MIRVVSVLVAMVLLLCLGYLAGRLPATTEGVRKARTLPGDDALEGAWEEFLGAQQAALNGLRASQFFVDDQERAEAYHAVLQDIQMAISAPSAVDSDGVLLGTLPGPDRVPVQLTPNRMAQRLEQAAHRLRARSEARLRLAAEAFGQAGGGVIEPEEAGMRVVLRHWELDNEEALLVRFPVSSPTSCEASLGNVWAMSLATASGESGASQRLYCTAGVGCRGILSHRDPGRPGWLDTGGHRRGVLVLRWRDGGPPPTAEKLRFADLQRRLDNPLEPDSVQAERTD